MWVFCWRSFKEKHVFLLDRVLFVMKNTRFFKYIRTIVVFKNRFLIQGFGGGMNDSDRSHLKT